MGLEEVIKYSGLALCGVALVGSTSLLGFTLCHVLKNPVIVGFSNLFGFVYNRTLGPLTNRHYNAARVEYTGFYGLESGNIIRTNIIKGKFVNFKDR